MSTHEDSIRLFIEENSLENLDDTDMAQATRQLQDGETWADVARRLRNWNREYEIERNCENAEAAWFEAAAYG